MFLEARNIKKVFGKESVLRSVDFFLPANRILSILGKSGSGKTTLLKILAGLEKADAGTVSLEGQVMNGVPAHRRNIVYLYQEPLLFPHLNVFENIAFGLRLRKVPLEEIQAKTLDMLEQLELSEHAQKRPDQLSGGQRQRVSFGRALIINPKVLLLDEPFGALDTDTRTSMQGLLQRMVRKYHITGLFVTHDLKEALLMGDEMARMEAGELLVYPSKQAFMEDARNGVQQELNFWSSLAQQKIQ